MRVILSPKSLLMLCLMIVCLVLHGCGGSDDSDPDGDALDGDLTDGDLSDGDDDGYEHIVDWADGDMIDGDWYDSPDVDDNEDDGDWVDHLDVDVIETEDDHFDSFEYDFNVSDGDWLDGDKIDTDETELDENDVELDLEGYECVPIGDRSLCTSMVTDINKSMTDSGSFPADYTRMGDLIFFTSENAQYGREVWIYDLADGEVFLLKDIKPGPGDSDPSDLIVFKNKLYFTAKDGIHGREIWRTDGSENGTELFAELYSGSTGSCFSLNDRYGPEFVIFKERLYFLTRNESVGMELWSTGGEAADITLLKDIRDDTCSDPNQEYKCGPYDMAVVGEYILFWESVDNDKSLWSTDGTADGTVEILSGGQMDSYNPVRLVINDVLYFVYDNGTHGYEIWRSDGTADGTDIVVDLVEGWEHASPREFIQFKDLLYFTAVNGSIVEKHESDVEYPTYGLFKTDGTADGTHEVADVCPLADSYGGNYKIVHDGSLYFIYEYARVWSNTCELWKLDGSDDSLTKLGRFYPSVPGRKKGAYPDEEGDVKGRVGEGHPRNFSIVNDKLVFTVGEETHVSELWSSDGTLEGTKLEISFGEGSYPDEARNNVSFGNFALMSIDDDIHGHELWRSDGTGVGTALLADINFFTNDAGISGMGVMGSRVYFAANDNFDGRELWRSDGTEEGTHIVADIDSGPGWSSPSGFLGLDGKIFFQANGDAGDGYFYVSDGTAHGTMRLHSPLTEKSPRYFQGAAVFNGMVYFNGFHKEKGRVLYRSKGANENTKVAALNRKIVDPWKLTPAETQLFFEADFGSSDGREPGVFDPSDRSGKMLKDIRPGSESSDSESYVALGDRLLFTADDGEHGRELWISDGTSNGTSMLVDIVEGEEDANPSLLRRWHDQVVFKARVQESEYALWISDGTAEGTGAFIDFVDQPARSLGDKIKVIDQRLYYSTRMENGDLELWTLQEETDAPSLVKVFVQETYRPNIFSIYALKDLALIMMNGPSYEEEKLWVTDGTPEGTLELQGPPSNPFQYFRATHNIWSAGNRAYFLAWDPRHGFELWNTLLVNQVVE